MERYPHARHMCVGCPERNVLFYPNDLLIRSQQLRLLLLLSPSLSYSVSRFPTLSLDFTSIVFMRSRIAFDFTWIGLMPGNLTAIFSIAYVFTFCIWLTLWIPSNFMDFSISFWHFFCTSFIKGLSFVLLVYFLFKHMYIRSKKNAEYFIQCAWKSNKKCRTRKNAPHAMDL